MADTVKRIKDFDKHSLADLRADAETLGLTVEENATRRQLAEAINAALDEPDTAPAPAPEASDDEQEVAAFEAPFDPVTFWLPGPAPLYPNPRVRIPGQRQFVTFRHGVATVTSQAEYDTVSQALAGIAFPEDMPKERTVKPCPQCGYAPRSTEAREAHGDCHPVLN
jgi:hypothetical protein